MTGEWLPYGRQWIDDEDIAAVVRVLQSDFVTTGPVLAAFEAALAEAVGARYAVACANGTAALHLAALALDLRAGEAILTSPITFLATANCARYVGADVRFADTEAGTANLDPAAAARALADANGAVRALFPVHFAGAPANMPALAALAAEHDLAVVEDASHALGATYRDRDGAVVQVGSCRHSVMATFSFHPVKHICTAEGGAITTNDESLYHRLCALRNHGMEGAPFADPAAALDQAGEPNPWYYELRQLGFNYRLSDVHAALGQQQLRKLDTFIARRRALARAYVARLAVSPLGGLVRPLANVDDPGHVFHLFVVRIDFARAGTTRAAVMHALREAGIGTQVHYIPVPAQPYYRERYGDLSLPEATAYYAECLSLPLFPAMPDGAVERVVAALERILGAG